MAWRRKQEIDGSTPGSRGSGEKTDVNPYLSIDPAPSCGAGQDQGPGGDVEVEELGRRLRDQNGSLFERYR